MDELFSSIVALQSSRLMSIPVNACWVRKLHEEEGGHDERSKRKNQPDTKDDKCKMRARCILRPGIGGQK